jgi:hypothetical protein
VTVQSPSGSRSFSIGDWRGYRRAEPLWFDATIDLLIFSAICLVAAGLDQRLLNGVSVWAKPFKFSLSLAIYFATLLVFIRYLSAEQRRTKSARFMVSSLLWVALLEMAYIGIQGGLGEASHYNLTTPFHSAMYSLMGAGATWLVLGLLWLGWLITKNHSLGEPMVLAIVLGLGLTFLLGGGFGSYLGGQAGHWVNGPTTDAHGIWLFNWATVGGDLRVAHFFGMHAMQAVPLFALLLPVQLSRRVACALVVVFSAAYAGFSAHTFVQAIQGQPFIG